MSTKLLRFKVINFRSVEESEWLDVSDNTCLVGTNEAGKTNLMIALWKLKPANNEKIRPLPDFPRHLYSRYKPDNHEKDIFIKAEFELSESDRKQLSLKLECEEEQVKIVLVERAYDGNYHISFPCSKINDYKSTKLKLLAENFASELNQSEAFNKESPDLKGKITAELKNILPEPIPEQLKKNDVDEIIQRINDFLSSELGRKVSLPELFKKSLINPLSKISDAFDGRPLEITQPLVQMVVSLIPKFVYYSDYGNLDSEIYLPRVIEDMAKEDELSESARAKVRTLDVLFKYVGLSPQEIHELGNDKTIVIKTVNNVGSLIGEEEKEVSEEEAKIWAEKKKERGVLLRSAASELTKSFKQWWQQGDYIFAFDADGNHFRINVADELRPEYIELEGRSRGLQWFFSFFLVFLVEAKEKLENSVLLLDEPGLSLHPLAQYDLAKFFKKLSEENQLIYTSHSPFLVDMDNLSNVKAIYLDKKTGRSKVSSDLRLSNDEAEKSVYPVHAALGLTVSDTFLLGCYPVLVEGPSDQIYMTLIKRFLHSKGLLKESKEIVFIPTGGVRGMKPIIRLVSSRDDKLPIVFLDSDRIGKDFKNTLLKDIYKDNPQRVLEVDEFVKGGAFEIEDLIPSKSLVEIIDRTFLAPKYFSDFYKAGIPIVDQVIAWAQQTGISLPEGWKVELARKCINQFDRVIQQVDENHSTVWEQLFSGILNK